MFGSNNWGQLGLGSKTSVNKPTCVKGWSDYNLSGSPSKTMAVETLVVIAADNGSQSRSPSKYLVVTLHQCFKICFCFFVLQSFEG